MESRRHHWEQIRQIGEDVIPLTPYRLSGYEFLVREGYTIVEITKREPYQIVGDNSGEETWLIHISIIPQQFHEFLDRASVYLMETGLPFSFPLDAEQHRRILDGRAGLSHVGRVVTIALTDEVCAEDVLKALLPLTEGYKGPAAVGCIHLQHGLYISYGRLAEKVLVKSGEMSTVCGNELVSDLQIRIKKGILVWPFNNYSYHTKKYPRVLKRQYLPVTTLKVDPKGSVFKAIRLNRLYNLQWCVLKQGNQNHCCDDAGRDVIDRLQWQHQVHQKLSGLIDIPQVQALFFWQGNAYLPLDYIEGQSLSEWITLVYAGRNWRSLEETQQQTLLQTAENVLRMIISMHGEAFIHRDLNPENFLVRTDGKLFLIDFELAYSSASKCPAPPFALGTRGYMSPQQRSGMHPEETDDIYALGGMLIKFFTGLSPLKFDMADPSKLFDQLSFFIPDFKLRSLIVKCLQPCPEVRPSLAEIGSVLGLYQSKIALKMTGPEGDEQELLEDTGQNTFTSALEILKRDILGIPGSERRDMPFELANGITGIYCAIIYLAITYLPEEKISFNSLLDRSQDLLHSRKGAGLLYGSAGTALFIAEAVRGGFILKDDLDEAALFRDLFDGPAESLEISGGCSGQGLALLKWARVWPGTAGEGLLRKIVDKLICLQRPDGSWVNKAGAKKSKAIRAHGLLHGTAGITLFLITYAGHYPDETLNRSIRRALDYLARQRTSQHAHKVWTTQQHNQHIDPWFEHGFTGIAFPFIRAYQLFGDNLYRQIANEALLTHPEKVSSNFLSLSNGLSGLGEVYLEAYQVFGEERWLRRARWIEAFFNHTGHDQLGHVWEADESGEYPKGLFNGQAGIIHFLGRCANPQRIKFPIF